MISHFCSHTIYLYVYIPELYFSLPTEGGLSTAEFAAQNYLVILVSILECDEPHALKLVSIASTLQKDICYYF